MSEASRNCFYIDINSETLVAPTVIEGLQPKELAILYGFSWLTRLADDPVKAAALIAFDQIQVAENVNRVLGKLMPGRMFDQFKKGQPVNIGAIGVSLITRRKHPPAWNGPVLVVFPSGDLMNTVDAIKGVTDVMVLPWQPLDEDVPVAAWIAKESASPIVPLV